MKIFKIIIGILLLFGAGREYVRTCKLFFTFFSPPFIIASLTVIIFSAWLIGSGLSKTKFKFFSFNYLKYFVLSFIIFLIIAFFSLITFKFEPEIVKVNGVNVDIAEYMNGTKRIIPDEKERREYCICMITKLTSDKNIINKFSNELKTGKIDKIIISLRYDTILGKLKLNECMSSISNFNWTPTFEKGMRENIMEQFKQSEYSKTNDINKYCGCIMNEYKKLPIKDITNSEFNQSKKAYEIDSLCYSKSKLH